MGPPSWLSHVAQPLLYFTDRNVPESFKNKLWKTYEQSQEMELNPFSKPQSHCLSQNKIIK